ncbi:putative transcriptional regulator SLK2 [Bienertia sinuspersici]
MDSNNQIQNVSEDFSQFMNSAVPSQNGGSSMWGNISHSAVQMPQQDAPYISLQSNAANSRGSLEESSLITVANSSYSGDSYLPNNGSNSTESFPPNRGGISFPSTMAHQQTSQEGQTYPVWSGIQVDQIPNSNFTPQLMNPVHQASVPLMNLKRPRYEMKQDDTLNAYSLQQPSSSQVPMQLNCHNSVAAARCNACPTSIASSTSSACNYPGHIGYSYSYEWKLMLSPIDDNNINYWKEFVEFYYSPVARRRWCFAKHANAGNGPFGIFNQATVDSWKCDFCGSKLEKGFEATYKVLPWLLQKNIEGGVIEELLYVDAPFEKPLPSGFMVLLFGRAVQESIYARSRVVHEGQLRIIFTQELKIISWEFCIQRHEDFISRRTIATQVLIYYFASWMAAAGNNIARSVKLSAVNDLGFSLPFARILQIRCFNNDSEALRRYGQQGGATSNSTPMQTPSSSNNNHQVANNIVTQTPNPNPKAKAAELQVTLYPTNQYQEQQAMKIQYGPFSARQLPPVDHQINDILASMRAEGTSAQTRNAAAGKGRLVCEPVTEETDYPEVVDKAKSKLLNYSSSSNSSAKVFADNCVVKREPESDDDSTSRARYQGNNGNWFYQHQ